MLLMIILKIIIAFWYNFITSQGSLLFGYSLLGSNIKEKTNVMVC